jgi:hypothetical protein
MAFTIESGVAAISNKRGRKPTDFPLGEMAVGDSFLIPIAVEMAEGATEAAHAEEVKKQVESWRRKFLIAKKRFNEAFEGKFQTAVVEGGLRVWRTE